VSDQQARRESLLTSLSTIATAQPTYNLVVLSVTTEITADPRYISASAQTMVATLAGTMSPTASGLQGLALAMHGSVRLAKTRHQVSGH
jgi:hypothetical protein